MACGVTIGRFALVGAGNMVTADVPDHALVVGNPAPQVGWAREYGLKLGHDLDCACGRTYELAGGPLTLGA